MKGKNPAPNRVCVICGVEVPHHKVNQKLNAKLSFLTIYLTIFWKHSQGKPHQSCQKVPICEPCLISSIGASDGTYGATAGTFAGALLRSVRDRYNSMRSKKAA